MTYYTDKGLAHIAQLKADIESTKAAYDKAIESRNNFILSLHAKGRSGALIAKELGMDRANVSRLINKS